MKHYFKFVFLIFVVFLLVGCSNDSKNQSSPVENSIYFSSTSSNLDDVQKNTDEENNNIFSQYSQMDQMVTLVSDQMFPNYIIKNKNITVQFIDNSTSILIKEKFKEDIEVEYSKLINNRLQDADLSFHSISYFSTIFFYQNQNYIHFFFEGTGGSDIPCIVIIRLDLSTKDFDRCEVYPNSALLTAAADENTFYVMGLTNPMAAASPSTESFISMINKETLFEYKRYTG